MAKLVDITYVGGRPLLQFNEIISLKIAAKFIASVYQQSLIEKGVKTEVRFGDMNISVPGGRAYGFFVDDPNVIDAIFEIVGGKEDKTEYSLHFTNSNPEDLRRYGINMQPFYNFVGKDISELIKE